MSSRSAAARLGVHLWWLFAASGLLLPALGVEPQRGDPDAWSILDRVRGQLSRQGPMSARFEQEYIPAGFSTGDQETGRLSLDLPRCVRWDYGDPFPKSFLLCGLDLHAWNPGEPIGQVFSLDSAEQPGLDLLLLSVDRLRERYSAALTRLPDRQLQIDLTPRPETEIPDRLTAATLRVDADTSLLNTLAYKDREGNRTVFTFEGYRPLSAAGIFQPPPGMRWEPQ